jgi:fermentation-respiration switch protein FrsA (DUF1100 family)
MTSAGEAGPWYQTRMGALKSILVFGIVVYLGIVGLLYVFQRGLMYPGDAARTSPTAAGLSAAEEHVLTSGNGEKVIAWHVPPKDGRPVVLYFHGNGGSLRHRVPRFSALTADGTGLIALSYRGYGGSTGSPTEEGLIADAEAAYAFVTSRYPPERVTVWGESLGTGVAVALASAKPVGKVVLEAPFTSAADVAASVYPFVPVRYLMKDQFRSDERILAVKAPVLIMHGSRDSVVPFHLGERLFSLAREPKRFVRFNNGGHEGLDSHGAMAEVKKFIAE